MSARGSGKVMTYGATGRGRPSANGSSSDIETRLENIEAQLVVMNHTLQEVLTSIRNLQSAGVRMLTHTTRSEKEKDDFL